MASRCRSHISFQNRGLITPVVGIVQPALWGFFAPAMTRAPPGPPTGTLQRAALVAGQASTSVVSSFFNWFYWCGWSRIPPCSSLLWRIEHGPAPQVFTCFVFVAFSRYSGIPLSVLTIYRDH